MEILLGAPLEPPFARSPKTSRTSPRRGEAGDVAEALEARVEALEARNRTLEARLQRMQLDASPSQSDERYRTILNSEPACVKLIAEDGRLLAMNPAGLKMLESDSEADIIGLCVFDLIRSDPRTERASSPCIAESWLANPRPSNSR